VLILLPLSAYQVIGASALVIIDAQQLLEMAEPAWHYDAYSKIWDIMAEDQQLEARLKFLETKVGDTLLISGFRV
jgi:hypothetical protein